MSFIFCFAAVHEFYKAPPEDFGNKVDALKKLGIHKYPVIHQAIIDACRCRLASRMPINNDPFLYLLFFFTYLPSICVISIYFSFR